MTDNTQIPGMPKMIDNVHHRVRDDGLDMDSIYANLVRVIGGIEKSDEALCKQIADKEYREKLVKEIARLEKKARAEKQPNKKFDLVRRIKKINLEMEKK